jgi:hypothetical protein
MTPWTGEHEVGRASMTSRVVGGLIIRRLVRAGARYQVRSILRELDAKNRTHAVAIALRNGTATS